jgi:hypothetical protein
MLNYGTVYPQALLVFVITLIYSVVSPLILPFGAIYFGMGYLVYKYKLLFGATSSLTWHESPERAADTPPPPLSRQCSTSPTSLEVRPGQLPSPGWSSASSCLRSL